MITAGLELVSELVVRRELDRSVGWRLPDHGFTNKTETYCRHLTSQTTSLRPRSRQGKGGLTGEYLILTGVLDTEEH